MSSSSRLLIEWHRSSSSMWSSWKASLLISSMDDDVTPSWQLFRRGNWGVALLDSWLSNASFSLICNLRGNLVKCKVYLKSICISSTRDIFFAYIWNISQTWHCLFFMLLNLIPINYWEFLDCLLSWNVFMRTPTERNETDWWDGMNLTIYCVEQ